MKIASAPFEPQAKRRCGDFGEPNAFKITHSPSLHASRWTSSRRKSLPAGG